MRGKPRLAAAILLALIMAGLRGPLSFADEQRLESKGRFDPRFMRSQHERLAHRLPSALPFTQHVHQQADVGPGNSGAVIATCPGASIVVGGGYAAHPDVTFYTQYKYGNGWRGDATNNGFVTRRFTVYAVCLHNVSGASVTQTHGQVDVPRGMRGQAVATCPAGSVATGGGFHAYPDGSLRVYNSSMSDSGQGWQSWAQNLSASPKTHHAYAICLSGTGGTTSDILKSAKIPPNGTGSAIAHCGSGSLVTAGGFAAQTNLLIYSNLGPYWIYQWRVYVKNTHPSDNRTLFGYAICLSLPQKPGYLYLPLVVEHYAP